MKKVFKTQNTVFQLRLKFLLFLFLFFFGNATLQQFMKTQGF